MNNFLKVKVRDYGTWTLIILECLNKYMVLFESTELRECSGVARVIFDE